MSDTSIIVTVGRFEARIGKPVDSFVNVFTNFKPINAAIFLLELDASDVVEYISNIAYYGDESGTGGISVKINPSYTLDDFKTTLEVLLKNNI